jgi:hypothetical protein
MDKTVVERISRFGDMGAILDYSSGEGAALEGGSGDLLAMTPLHGEARTGLRDGMAVRSRRGYQSCRNCVRESGAVIDKRREQRQAGSRMASHPHLRWEPPDYDPAYEPDIGEGEDERPRDPVVDQAKDAIRAFINKERANVFYKQQLEVIFEDDVEDENGNRRRGFFHWVTSRALSELAAEGHIAAEREVLPGVGAIVLYHATMHRYWRRQAQDVIALVSQFSAPAFTAGLGAQGELMFDAALASVGFLPTAREVKAHRGKEWKGTEHDLDRVFSRDGVSYGAEIKNTLKYIPRNELTVKIKMCQHLGLRPLFIVRAAAKSYINEVRLLGSLSCSSISFTRLDKSPSRTECVRVCDCPWIAQCELVTGRCRGS